MANRIVNVSCLPDTDKIIIKAAIQVKNNAYTPYSKFNVGAAVITDTGTIYTGCCVDNAVYPLSTCAERTAIVKAVSDGERTIECIAIAFDVGKGVASPCGNCRQIIYEFGHATNCTVLMVKGEDECIRTTIKELLPEGFGPDSLKDNHSS